MKKNGKPGDLSKNKTAGKKKLTAAKKTGRPSTYTKEKADAVIDLMHRGVWVTEACRQVGVPIVTFLNWCTADKDSLSERSMRAREVCYEVMGHKTIEMAQEMPLTNPMTGAIDSAAVQWKRLQVDTMFRLLGKLAPNRWGEKLDVNHSGKIGIEKLIAEAGAE